MKDGLNDSTLLLKYKLPEYNFLWFLSWYLFRRKMYLVREGKNFLTKNKE